MVAPARLGVAVRSRPGRLPRWPLPCRAEVRDVDRRDAGRAAPRELRDAGVRAAVVRRARRARRHPHPARGPADRDPHGRRPAHRPRTRAARGRVVSRGRDRGRGARVRVPVVALRPRDRAASVSSVACPSPRATPTSSPNHSLRTDHRRRSRHRRPPIPPRPRRPSCCVSWRRCTPKASSPTTSSRRRRRRSCVGCD